MRIKFPPTTLDLYNERVRCQRRAGLVPAPKSNERPQTPRATIDIINRVALQLGGPVIVSGMTPIAAAEILAGLSGQFAELNQQRCIYVAGVDQDSWMLHGWHASRGGFVFEDRPFTASLHDIRTVNVWDPVSFQQLSGES